MNKNRKIGTIKIKRKLIKYTLKRVENKFVKWYNLSHKIIFDSVLKRCLELGGIKMGINLGSMMNNMRSNANDNGVNALNLKKNDVLNLTKKNPGLKKVILGAGWDVASIGQDFDLDIAAFLLNANGKVQNIPDDVIFFNNMQGQGIYLEGDNRTGVGDGDDERIRLDLESISSHVQKIVFVVTIHEAQAKRQTFGMVENSYVRILDEERNEKEICRFNLKENGSTVTSVIFAELYKVSGEWQFKAIGEGKIADLNGILGLYM